MIQAVFITVDGLIAIDWVEYGANQALRDHTLPKDSPKGTPSKIRVYNLIGVKPYQDRMMPHYKEVLDP